MIMAGGTGGHVFPGLAVAAKLVSRAAGACSGSARATAWRRRSSRSTASTSKALRFAASAARAGACCCSAVRAGSRLLESLRVIRAAARRRARLRRLRVVPRRLMAWRAASRSSCTSQRRRRARQSHPRVWRGPRAARLPGRLRQSKRATWIGNPVRDDIVAVDPPARASPVAAVRCACSSSAAASARGAERRGAGGARHCPKRSGRDRAPGRRAPHRRPAQGVRSGGRDRGVRAVHRRHGGALCGGGPRRLPRRRADGRGARRRRPGCDRRPVPGAIADEQTANARFLLDAGAAIVVAQSELRGADEPLAGIVGALTRSDALTMALAAHHVGKRDAADRVADVCMALAGAHT